MKANGMEISTVRDLLDAAGVSGAEAGRALDLGKWQINRRLNGEAKWTALDVLRLHRFLKRRRIRHSVLGLLTLCARSR